MLTVGSLCTGFAGLDMAAELVLGPLDHRFVAEVDPDASTVLAAHYPAVPNLGDITAVDWRTVEMVDVLTAGFPCQSMSNAGKRLGSNDERFLWPEVARAVNVLRPATLLAENVPGLLTIEQGGVFALVLSDLDVLGYTVSWTTVGACKVGACHHRHRVFLYATREVRPVPARQPLAWRDGGTGPWVGYETTLFGDHEPFGDWPPAGTMAGGYIWADPADPCGATGITTLPTPTARLGDRWGQPNAETAHRRIFDEGRRNLEDAIALLPTVTASDTTGPGHSGSGGHNLRTVAAMLPTPCARDATRGKGWADMESGRPLSEVIAALLPTPLASDAEGGSGRRNTHGHPKLTGAVGLLPTPRASDAAKGGPNQRGSSGDWALPAAVQPDRFGAYEAAVRRHERMLGGPVPDPTEPGKRSANRLSAAFTEWMICAPAGWITDHVGREAAIRLAGNGVVAPAGAWAYRSLGVGASVVRNEAA